MSDIVNKDIYSMWRQNFFNSEMGKNMLILSIITTVILIGLLMWKIDNSLTPPKSGAVKWRLEHENFKIRWEDFRVRFKNTIDSINSEELDLRTLLEAQKIKLDRAARKELWENMPYFERVKEIVNGDFRDYLGEKVNSYLEKVNGVFDLTNLHIANFSEKTKEMKASNDWESLLIANSALKDLLDEIFEHFATLVELNSIESQSYLVGLTSFSLINFAKKDFSSFFINSIFKNGNFSNMGGSSSAIGGEVSRIINDIKKLHRIDLLDVKKNPNPSSQFNNGVFWEARDLAEHYLSKNGWEARIADSKRPSIQNIVDNCRKKN